MNPAEGQFANVVNLEQKRIEKNKANLRSKSPYGPVQSGLVKPVTETPAEDRALANPEKEVQRDEDNSNV